MAAPGLAAVTPGSGEAMIAPVSVCHQVSTPGVLLAPNTSRYQHQAAIGGAAVHERAGLVVEDIVVGVGDLGQVAAGGVQDALRLPGGAGGVEDVQRMLGIKRLGLVLLRGIGDGFMPPQVTSVGP